MQRCGVMEEQVRQGERSEDTPAGYQSPTVRQLVQVSSTRGGGAPAFKCALRPTSCSSASPPSSSPIPPSTYLQVAWCEVAPDAPPMPPLR